MIEPLCLPEFGADGLEMSLELHNNRLEAIAGLHLPLESISIALALATILSSLVVLDRVLCFLELLLAASDLRLLELHELLEEANRSHDVVGRLDFWATGGTIKPRIHDGDSNESDLAVRQKV